MSPKFELLRARCPEEVGVNSEEIKEFFEDMKENNLEFHSFMVIRNGKVACEFYRKPFDEKTSHELFSVSKSLTSTAVGLAISEGYFTLDTRLVDVFPEYKKPNDKRLNKLKIRHLVSMTSGKLPNITFNQRRGNWIKRYFDAPWYGEPGEYKYVNENIYMLCAVIVRKTGMSVREFLTPRFFEPLGIEVPYWATDSDGIECGGWGANMTLQDVAKMMFCYQQGGKIGKKQIIPENWVREATAMHVDTSRSLNPDSRAGYGYCFWRNSRDNESYRADGMFSQFGIVLEKYNAIVISLGAIPDEEEARNCIWRHFPKAFCEPNPKAKTPKLQNFEKLAENYPIDNPTVARHDIEEGRLNNSTIRLNKKLFLNLAGYPVSALPLVVSFRLPKKVGNIDNVNFTFEDNECLFSWSEGKEKNTVPCGMDGHFRYSKIHLGGKEFTVCCYALWENGAIKVNIRPIKTIAKRVLSFSFNGDIVKMKPTATPNVNDICNGLLTTLEEAIHKKAFKKPAVKIASCFAPFAEAVFEPTHRGSLVNRKDIY